MPNVIKSGGLNLLEPSGAHRACYWTALPLRRKENSSFVPQISSRLKYDSAFNFMFRSAPLNRIGRGDVWFYRFLISVLDGRESSTSYPGGVIPNTKLRHALTIKLNGPHIWSGHLGEQKNLLTPLEFELQTVRSLDESLH